MAIKRFTTAELAKLALPGFPKTSQGWDKRVKSERWDVQVVRGRGRGGERHEYKPPADIAALIEQRLRGEIPSDPVPSVTKLQVESPVATYAVTPANSEVERDRDILEAVLRIGEYRIKHNQVSKQLIEFASSAAPFWLEAARDHPDLQYRLQAMLATLRFIGADE